MTEDSIMPVMFDWYTRYYAVVGSSQANAIYCRQVYDRNYWLIAVLSKSGRNPAAH
jgi:hypothetical protein